MCAIIMTLHTYKAYAFKMSLICINTVTYLGFGHHYLNQESVQSGSLMIPRR